MGGRNGNTFSQVPVREMMQYHLNRECDKLKLYIVNSRSQLIKQNKANKPLVKILKTIKKSKRNQERREKEK